MDKDETMNTMLAIRARVALFLLLLLSGLVPATPASARAQDVPLLSTKVADILARFPASGFAERDRLADEMLALGEPGIAEFTRRLVPLGSGNDTAVRFALNAMATCASQAGAEPKRALAERALANALGPASDPEVRTFLLSQLRLVGRAVAVKAASPYLLDPALVEPATQLMLTVKSPAARAALVAALGKAKGPGQITIVKALGQLKAVEALDRLSIFAKDPDPAMRRPALAALASVASPRSYTVLTEAAKSAGFQYEPANAIGALLEYARQLGQKGAVVTSDKVCRLIMKNTDDAERLPTRAAALAILADVRGQAALPDLLKAVEHADRGYRNAALMSAEPIRGAVPVNQWVAKAKKVDAERRAEIIAMLGRQGDRRALPFIRSSLAASEPEVALAAAEALAHVEHAVANPDLLVLLKTRTTSDEAQRVAAVLLWTMDEQHLGPLAGMLDTLQPPAKAAALRVIGARGGKRYAGQVLPLTSDANPEIRAAAIGALAGVVGAGDLPAVLRLLDGAADASAIADLQKATVAAASQIAPEEVQARPLVDAMKTAAHPERIVELLPQIGGPQALAAVNEQFDGPAPAMKAVAFRALAQWRGPEAADRLFAIYASKDPAYSGEAFSGFVRQISSSSLPAEQKVLQLRKALALATTARERRTLIRALERARTFQSFLVAASFLDDPEIANDAAGAVMRIALPASGERDGLSGTLVRNALGKVLEVLTGPESDYEKENIRTYLAAMPKGEGFVPLFNGKDLTGWKGLVENPIARAKMSPQELAARQVEADAKARATWSVRDGTIVFSGTGDNLCTVKDYGDFEMLVDWRITKGGDSGIYLRGTPQVQVWDPARTDAGAEVGSGGLYNNQKNPSKPLVRADNPVGEWNTFHIAMVGDKVTVYLNGTKVVDNVTLENYWDRTQAIFARGPIELQAHGTDLAFRDLYVREIGAVAPGLTTDEERADGFVPLFNGRDLDGWTGNVAGYRVEDGSMVYDPNSGDRTNVYTAREYSDFQLRFEFQLTPGANSGVGIRTPGKGDAAYVGMEIQVLDDSAPVYATLQPYQYHGSVYGVIPAKRGFQKAVGEWNSEEILVRGSHVKVTLNGTVIVDGDLVEASRDGTMDHQAHPGLQRASGYIGWLSHGSVVSFRNVRIKELR
jgi:3-keto-disaccharide hydrolase/HEAT repeats